MAGQGPTISWHWTVIALCWIGTALIVSYEVWARSSIPAQLSQIEAVQIGVVRLPCSAGHFWGNVILYRAPGAPERWGHVCRDWLGRKWVFNDDKGL